MLYRHDNRLYFLRHRKNSMERLYGILPVKKSEMVMGRYLFVVVLGVIALVVSLITQPIVLRALGETVEPFDIISAAIGGLFLFALYTVFQIPGYYKFGSIKGRVFMYIPVAGFLVTLFLLPKLPADNPIINAIASSPVLLLTLAIALVIVMYAVSIWFSVQIMKIKKCEVDSMDFTILAVVLLIGVGIPVRNKLIRKYREEKRNRIKPG